MEFSLNEAQNILKNEVRRFLNNECPIDVVREMMEDEKGYPPSLWKKMADLGWMGVLFEEKYGGLSGTFLDLAIILEEMGRSLLPGPFFSTVVLGGVTIMTGANEELKQKFLPRIASGDIVITLAFTETADSYDIGEIESMGELGADHFVLKGKKMFVSDAHIADYIISPVEIKASGDFNGISLFIINAKSKGISVTPLLSLDLRKQFLVNFADVIVPKDSLIGDEGRGWFLLRDIWPMVVTGKCCEMLGGMQRVLEITLDYVQKRHQFGRPLSGFQVIQHYCADMAILLECSKFVTYQAAWRITENLPTRKEVAMAKAWSSDAFKKITKMAHQIHGAIGFTKEQNLCLYFRHAKASEILFGDANFHKEIVAKEMD